MEKIWLKHYPPGVPAEIDVNEYESMRDLFEESVAQVRDAAGVHVHGQVDHVRRARHAVGGVRRLAAGHGCKKGTRVALMMPNILQYPVCLFGTLRAGCTVVNVNPLYTARELEHQLEGLRRRGDRRRRELRAHAAGGDRQDQGAAGGRHRRSASCSASRASLVNFVVRHVKKMVPAFVAARRDPAVATRWRTGRRRKLERVPIGHDDIAFLQYTGGTTGVAKGAMLLHRNIVANMLQARAWVQPFLDREPARGHHHAAAALPHLLADGELPRVHDARRRERADPESARHPGLRQGDGASTSSPRSPASTRCSTRWSTTRSSRKLDFSSLRITLGGGMAVQEAVAQEVEEGHRRAADRGLRPHRDLARGDDQSARPAGVQRLDRPADPVDRGRSCATTPARTCALGQPGEICIRGPQVMAGYWQPARTRPRRSSTGRLVRDRRHRRDGRAAASSRIVDRKKDMILVSGFNVYPNEIEGVVAMHPGVLECAAVGVPDEKSGEAVQAVRREEGPGADRRGRAEALPRAPDRLQGARATSSSAPTCRRPTSARSCAASCATRRRRRRASSPRRDGGDAHADDRHAAATASRCCASCRCRPTSTSTATSSAAGSCRRSTSPAASWRRGARAAGWRPSRSIRSCSRSRCWSATSSRSTRRSRAIGRTSITVDVEVYAQRNPRRDHRQGDRGEPDLRRGRGRPAAAGAAARPDGDRQAAGKRPGNAKNMARFPAAGRSG